MIKLVVFDWNGVLIADAQICAEANSDVLEAYGAKRISLARYRDTVVVPANDFYLKNGLSMDTLSRHSRDLSSIFHRSYERRALKVRTRRSARKLLSWLAQRSIEAIILSDHTVSGVESQLQRLHLRKYFSHVLANSELDASLKGRMKQKRLEVFLKNNSVRPHSALIIGDSPQEVEVGKHIGITTVAITEGFFSTKRLKESKPDYLISSLNQLIGIIEKLR